MREKLKIIFMGTPDFAVEALNAIIESGHDVICVYSQPPRPSGRGHRLKSSPVQCRAEELNIPVCNPLNLKKDATARKKFTELKADVAVVAAYGLILPQKILDAPKYGCINIHGSLLPRWRGAAPIQRAILAGDKKSGICIMKMDAGLDTGAVYMRGSIDITNTTTASDLHDNLAVQGADLIVKTLDLIASGNIPSLQEQSEGGTTYAKMLSKNDGKIDWKNSAFEIERQLRALHPWPGVWCMFKGKRLKILEVKLSEQLGNIGEILDKKLTIACGEGSLVLEKIQPENKKPMSGESFMNGHAKIGDLLE